jgi:hypothetical protein
MSQIFKATSWEGNPVEILTGWDGLTSQLFVKVALLDETGEWRDDVPLVLDAWKNITQRPTEINAAASLAMGIRDKLRPLGMDVSDLLLGEVAAHLVLDARNVVVRYEADDSRSVLQSDIEGYE